MEAYGLITVPLCWYKRVCAVMAEAGFTRMESDPCCWVLHDDSDVKSEDKELERKRTRTRHWNVVAVVCTHVDDFIFAGREWDRR
jgi:hypothetical protein